MPLLHLSIYVFKLYDKNSLRNAVERIIRFIISVINQENIGISDENILEICKQAIVSEANALMDFSVKVDDAFLKALHLIKDAKGPLVVVGIGKSGLVARKISSSFSSIGQPSLFLHAAEASHGDMGQISKDSVVLALSNSGETSELFQVMSFCLNYDIPMISITANADSTLAKSSTVAITYGKLVEVCPNGLAPTTTTTLSLAIGDALVVGLINMIGTEPEDFHKYHPGGKLGAKFLKVGELMHAGAALPIVTPETPMSEVVITISEKSLGIAVVVEDGFIKGVISDGDLRRNAKDLWNLTAAQVCSANPITTRKDAYATKALELMSERAITCCIVANDDNQLVGVIHIHDCLRAGVIA